MLHYILKIVNQHYYLLCFSFFLLIEITKRIILLFYIRCSVLRSLVGMYTTFTSTSISLSTINYFLSYKKFKTNDLFVTILLLAFIVTFVHWFILGGILHLFNKNIILMLADIGVHLINLCIPVYDYLFIRKRKILVRFRSLIYAFGILIFYSTFVHICVVNKWTYGYPYVRESNMYIFNNNSLNFLALGGIILPLICIAWIFFKWVNSLLNISE